ncbi:hypothetical protein C8A00DRAFT_41578 [Chaetomidium leptoderma]|uniref:Aminoglycoside phosphotransferase domain-containing protein n=1 Tax=Chaetomidium leptoderma TaxID=669021 RepID=A0AAN6ZZF3_9PEZI|nr:hypothetical protein C8A00DRAFT_41578 [Chaetomidium leptoderma]
MFANPLPPFHQPNHPTDHDRDRDPFQSLYQSLSNLSLTTNTVTTKKPPSTTHAPVPAAHSFPDLPTPAQVRQEAARLAIVLPAPTGNGAAAAALVPFPSRRLLVKYYHGCPGADYNGNGHGGDGVSAVAAEGKAMTLVRGTLLSAAACAGAPVAAAEEVPVPEVFGGGTVGFVGSVDNGPLQDELFQGCAMAGAPPPGPFPTVDAFHDYFVSVAATVSHSQNGGAQLRYPRQNIFPAYAPIVFTHGGLHPRNIIVSAGPRPRVVSILGWEQAGWYPAYWEMCKARWECSRRGDLGDWMNRYLPWILDAEGLNAEIPGWNKPNILSST